MSPSSATEPDTTTTPAWRAAVTPRPTSEIFSARIPSALVSSASSTRSAASWRWRWRWPCDLRTFTRHSFPGGVELLAPCDNGEVRQHRIVLGSLGFLLLLAAAGCSWRASDYQYLRSRSTGTYLRLPKSWDVVRVESDDGISFARAFDGDGVEDESALLSRSPAGLVQVRELDEAERKVMSLALARNLLYAIDQGVESGVVEIVDVETVDQGDFVGERVVFEVETDLGPATVSQVVMVAPRSSRVHHLVVACTTACHDEHEAEIEAVLESLTLKEA
ncbi:MAG TPA: hypothetical protein VFV35_07115 [Acidimicrobiales bacterium]|nr:hypothetical protein [Acidimicrobiales bacterium]